MTYEDCEKAGISEFVARPGEKVVPFNEVSLEDHGTSSQRILEQMCDKIFRDDFKKFGTDDNGRLILLDKEEIK